ncbi:MAG: hypothetical protein OEZ39_15025 [Gammaproteobacteria bacterium]|nr:hypothetical protein [Gammaproteobacteria bacterium]MDH5653166.1 hypothetical protein [Gammaproteobacteria bacterium]
MKNIITLSLLIAVLGLAACDKKQQTAAPTAAPAATVAPQQVAPEQPSPEQAAPEQTAPVGETNVPTADQDATK